MSEQCHSRLIERPSGLCGYRPAFWCAVCGRKAAPQTDKHCTTESCPNLCHVRCLSGVQEFNCENTGQLRALTGITDPVTSACPPTGQAQANYEDPSDVLVELEKEDLVQLVRKLQQELASAKAQLTHYRSTTTDLEGKRCVLVEALAVVDTLLATHASEDIQQRTVACTARADRIDAAAEPIEQEHRENSILPPPSNTPQPPNTPPPPSHSQSPRRGSNSAEDRRGHTVTIEESVGKRKHSSQQFTQSNNTQPHRTKRKEKPRKQTCHKVTPQQATPHPGQQQASRCELCKRSGHTRDQCLKQGCDYCHGRSHSSQNCRIKIADQRQQELVDAVRQSNQETLTALKTVTCQLQQPASYHRVAGPILTAPRGAPVNLYPWAFSPPTPAYHYGPMPQLPQSGWQ